MNDAETPQTYRVGFHVHTYLAVAVLLLSAVPFVLVILLRGDAAGAAETLTEALGAVAVLHVALAFAQRRCSTPQLRFWDGIRLITAYMTIGIGGMSLLIAAPCAIVALLASIAIAVVSVTGKSAAWAPTQFRRMVAFAGRHRMYQ
jgi:2-keto-4-pentenoate hydratase